MIQIHQNNLQESFYNKRFYSKYENNAKISFVNEHFGLKCTLKTS